MAVIDKDGMVDKITCPHCWAEFDTPDVLWIAEHSQLTGDPRLGSDAQRRFLPTRFTPGGMALDEMNKECERIACRACHLELPRAAAEMPACFVSVIGAPASGKSFYLGALIHELRRLLPGRFRTSFTDADAALNWLINHYEQCMFGHPRPDDPIDPGELIGKTQQGKDGWMSRVVVGGQEVYYPKPFVFAVRPNPAHPQLSNPESAAHLLYLYDVAGEAYQANADSAGTPATRHLAKADMLLFLFDPTQDSQFRQAVLAGGAAGVPADDRLKLRQQHTFLSEAALRVRKLANLSSRQKHTKPLVVVVTKSDLWGHKVPALANPQTALLQAPNGIACLNYDRVMDVSAGIRKLLLDLCPGMVDTAESFAEEVYYVAASSFGSAPDWVPGKPWTIRPRDIKPKDVEIPFLFGLGRFRPGLIPFGRQQLAPQPSTPRS